MVNRLQAQALKALKELDAVIDSSGGIQSEVADQLTDAYLTLTAIASGKSIRSVVKSNGTKGFGDFLKQSGEMLNSVGQSISNAVTNFRAWMAGVSRADYDTFRQRENELKNSKAIIQNQVIPTWTSLGTNIQETNSDIANIIGLWKRTVDGMELTLDGSLDMTEAMDTAQSYLLSVGRAYGEFFNVFYNSHQDFLDACDLIVGGMKAGEEASKEATEKAKSLRGF